MWSILFSAVASLLGLPALIAGWMGKRRGAANQRAKDVEQELGEARTRERVEADNDRLSTDALRNSLLNSARRD